MFSNIKSGYIYPHIFLKEYAHFSDGPSWIATCLKIILKLCVNTTVPFSRCLHHNVNWNIFKDTGPEAHILCLLLVSHYPAERCLLLTVSEGEILLPVAWDVYKGILALAQELCAFHHWVPVEDHLSPDMPECLLINEWDNFGLLLVLSGSLQIYSKAYIWNKASWITAVTEEQIFWGRGFLRLQWKLSCKMTPTSNASLFPQAGSHRLSV